MSFSNFYFGFCEKWQIDSIGIPMPLFGFFIIFSETRPTQMTCPPDIGPGVVLKFYWTKGGGNGQETLHS